MARKFKHNPHLPQERVNEMDERTRQPEQDAKKRLTRQKAAEKRSDKPIDRKVGKGRLDRPNPAPPERK